MVTYRVRVCGKIMQQLRDKYNNRLFDEFGFVPSDSIVVTIALLEFQTMQEDRELEIKFKKNGKLQYKIK